MYSRYKTTLGDSELGAKTGKTGKGTKKVETKPWKNLLPKASNQDEDTEKLWWMDRFFNNTDSEGESDEEPIPTPEKPPVVDKPEEEPTPKPDDKPVVKPEDKPVVKPEEEVVLEPLAIDINLLSSQNKVDHNTKDFNTTIFAIRRGQEFVLKIDVNRPFNQDRDKLCFTFMIGEIPQASKGTLVRLVAEPEAPPTDNPYAWRAHVTKVEATPTGNSQITVTVKAAANCPVGNYKLKVSYFRKENKKEKRVSKTVEAVYILFNAWCKHDQVYLASADERTEYVLRETGKIYTGSDARIYAKSWNFGQFSKDCLKTVMLLLERSRMPNTAQGNPTQVTRVLSAQANFNDFDQGLLVGNWTGDYRAGTSPTDWIGSVPIFKKYLETNSVRFGQCWVFSGVITSLCRCLGIPTRSVTNFDSAHDTDVSLTIDYHVDENGDPMKSLNDSVWNFHVWNECWFKRPDLPAGCDGWQAVDGTPQELSDGMMQCGPAPVACIKEGNVHLGKDTKFVYAEVAGTKVNWRVDKKMNYAIISTDDDGVGHKISTKAVLSADRHDITDTYKYTNDQAKLEEVRKKVIKFTNDVKMEALSKEMGLADKVKDVVFEYRGDTSENGDVQVEVNVQNAAQVARNVSVTYTANAGFYTGATGKRLKKEKIPITLEPGKSQLLKFPMKGKDYLNEINDDAMLSTLVTAHVKETGQNYIKEKSFPLWKPDLIVKVYANSDDVKVGKELEVDISFKNPLDMELTNAFIVIEGPGIQKEKRIPIERNVQANEIFTEIVTLIPKYPGLREIVAAFNSRQLIGLTGAVTVDVNE